MNKQKISVRLNPHNYDMLRAVADTMFLNKRTNEGNLSEALDWILSTFRLKTGFDGLMYFLYHLSKYERGNREQETIDAVRSFQVYIKTVTS